ncbi:MAG TPA: low affinity iron permease family protein [Devosia sp.]
MTMSANLSRAINGVASFLSTAYGFILTFIALLVGIGIGVMLQFNDVFMFGFNLFLSVAAIVISGIILVSGARSEAALHVKLDYLIEYSKATNKAIGLEHKDVAEIERERAKVEEHAKLALDEAIDEAVEEEVAEQLDARGVKRRGPSVPAE